MQTENQMIYTNQMERKKGNTKNEEKTASLRFKRSRSRLFTTNPILFFVQFCLIKHVSMANIVEFPASHCVANGACLLMNPIHANPFSMHLRLLYLLASFGAQ